jgi:hypothetical protein
MPLPVTVMPLDDHGGEYIIDCRPRPRRRRSYWSSQRSLRWKFPMPEPKSLSTGKRRTRPASADSTSPRRCPPALAIPITSKSPGWKRARKSASTRKLSSMGARPAWLTLLTRPQPFAERSAERIHDGSLYFLFPASVNSIPVRTPPDVVSVLTRPKTGASLDSQTFDSDSMTMSPAVAVILLDRQSHR